MISFKKTSVTVTNFSRSKSCSLIPLASSMFPAFSSMPDVDLKSDILAFFETDKRLEIDNLLVRTAPGEYQNIFLGLNTFFNKVPEGTSIAIVEKMACKLAGIVGIVLPELHSENIPERIRAKLTVEKITDFFLEVASKVNVVGVLDYFEQDLVRYNGAVGNIKKHLFYSEDQHAIGWKPRNPFLFTWCRILIEKTGHPAVRNGIGERGLSHNLIDQLYNSFTKFVLPLTCADDVADIVRDKDLLSYFADFLSGIESYAALKSINIDSQVERLPKKYEIYSDFFRLYLSTLSSALISVSEILGDSAMERNWDIIQSSWESVMKCLRQSVDINHLLTSGQYVVTIQEVNVDEIILSQNMLMSFFKVLEDVVITEYNLSDPTARNPKRAIIFEKAEILGHAANHWATLPREVGEGDYSNTILVILGCTLTHHLELRRNTFSDYCKSVFKVDLPKKVVSFGDLLSYLRRLDREAVILAVKALDGSSNFEDRLQFANSPRDLLNLVREHSCTVPTKLEEVVRVKEALSDLVLNLAKKLDILEIYGSRIDSIFSELEQATKLRTSAQSVPGISKDEGPFASFIDGVEDLVALYLACKKEI